MNSSDVWKTFSENIEFSTLQINRAKEDVIQIIQEYQNKPVESNHLAII